MFCTVGEIAKKLNIAPSTIRYYDKEGLLPFVERSDSGIRMFDNNDLEWLKTIECLKKTGMQIKDIKVFIDWCIEGDSTIEQRLDIIKRQQKAVEQQICGMKETLDVLKYKCWYYETAKKAGTVAIHTTMKEEDMPEEIRLLKQKMDRIKK